MTADERLRLVPELRFVEFANEPPWECIPLNKLATRVTERNTRGADLKALTNSAKRGVVDQREYFDKAIATSTETYFVVEHGDYVYNPRVSAAAPVGPISKNLIGPGVVSPLYAVFRFRSDANDFFAHYFRSSHWHGYLRRVSNSGARHDRMAINNADLMAMPMPTPSPPEQQKIADCAGSLDDLIASEGRKLEALRLHKQGLMQQLLPADGSSEPRVRFPAFAAAAHWKRRPLEELAQRGTGHTPRKSEPEFYDGGVKWVSLADSWRLDSGLILETDKEVSQKGLDGSSAVLHPPGTVILSRDAGVGKSAVLGDFMAVSQHFVVWQCDENRLHNWFLYYVLQRLKPAFDRVATGSTVKTIGMPFFRELAMAVPTNVEEQIVIGGCLRAIDETLTAQGRRIEALRQHRRGLLQKIFPAPDDHAS